MQLIYNISIFLYGALIHIASLFNGKAKKWVQGRKNWVNKLKKFERSDKPLYWFHCASLGEFEQGRPIMEAIKSKEDCQLIVSFFSPSGYEIKKDYNKADLVFYLPLDTPKHAKLLVDLLKPTKVFFIKYEFWANLILRLKNNHVPVFLASGIFRKEQLFFKWYGGFYKSILKNFSAIFVQDEASFSLLKSIDVKSIITGDTRYDRVVANSKLALKIELIDKFCGGEKLFVVGSSWLEDDLVIMPLINSESFIGKVIIAPHEINESRIKEIEKQLKKPFIRYSEYSGSENAEVLIIDNIGILMHVYQYAKMAYVGGGFKTGLHNILEPASFGVPTVFGPKHHKFPEANLFINNGIGYEVATAKALISTYNNIQSNDYSKHIIDFMKRRTGASQLVLKHSF